VLGEEFVRGFRVAERPGPRRLKRLVVKLGADLTTMPSVPSAASREPLDRDEPAQAVCARALSRAVSILQPFRAIDTARVG
jgi:hypothetical protein